MADHAELPGIPAAVRPERIDGHRYAVVNTGDAGRRDVVFGGQLLAHECPYAGRGRSFGTADVFTEDARSVASYVQTNMIRFFADPSMADGTQYRTVM